MVLRALRLPPLDEPTLSMLLGLRVPTAAVSDYPGSIADDDPTSHGIRLRDKELQRLSCFLQQFGFELKTSFHPIANIQRDNFPEYVSELLSRDEQLVIGYDYKIVFEEGESLGHMGLITGVTTNRSEIDLVEPEDGVVARVDESKLFTGASAFRSGIWSFST